MLADVTISQGLVEWGIGLLSVQLIGAVAWAVRLQMQVTALRQQLDQIRDRQSASIVAMERERVDADAVQSRVVLLEEQYRTVFRALERIEAKIDRLGGER